MDITRIFKSKTREALFRLYFTNPEKSFYLRELERELDIPVSMLRKELISLEKILYSNEIPTLDAIKSEPEQKKRNLLLVKSSDWEYEEEYRLLYRNGANKSFTIDNGIIDHVILGCNISTSNRKKIISILKTKITIKDKNFESNYIVYLWAYRVCPHRLYRMRIGRNKTAV